MCYDVAHDFSRSRIVILGVKSYLFLKENIIMMVLRRFIIIINFIYCNIKNITFSDVYSFTLFHI